VPPSERRLALGARKERRPHPASPTDGATRASRAPAGIDRAGTSKLGDEQVMLCVRVPPSLRRRIKLAAVQSGQPVQQLAAEALEAQCQRHGV
jgi:hypothetical protein